MTLQTLVWECEKVQTAGVETGCIFADDCLHVFFCTVWEFEEQKTDDKNNTLLLESTRSCARAESQHSQEGIMK